MTANEEKKVQLEEHAHQEMAEEISPELEAFLHTDPSKGLTTAEVTERLAKFGPNQLTEVKKNVFLKFLGYFTGAIAYLIEIAWILSAVVQDWVNFGIIGALLLVNAAIGFIEESKAENALDALKNTLALKTRVWRNGDLIEIDVSDLVPGDIIVLRLGDIVPADCRLLGIGVHGEPVEGNLQIDQSALTGESLPVSKGKGATAYSSSIVKQGQQMGVVTKTGENTFIGRAATLMSNTNEQGHFQKIINKIGNFLVFITVVLVVILFIVLMVKTHAHDVLNIIKDVLVLTVAAIPVGLPTVMSVTMAVGAKQLAKKEVIVKRLTAVEEMASVSVLCSDKTGTLTLNELTFDEPWLCKGYSSDDILLYSYMAAEQGANDPIEYAVRTAARSQLEVLKSLGERDTKIPGFKTNSFLPFNPVTKLTQATILNEETGETFKVAKGAPQVIIKLVGGNDDAVHAVNSLARRGLRALGVARTIPGDLEQWELIGMISLLDPPRPDSAETIARCHEMGVSVKMITGDQLIIAKEVAQRLGMQRAILDAHKLVEADVSEEEIVRRCVKADGFAQVIPEHKYRVVELLQEQGLLVGMTGDGVNDAPALKKANVGIAVHGCTDAARSASDIVLLAPGLSTIVDGITTSRAIFQRMRSYALYRITSTIHFLLFFFFVTIIYQWKLEAILLIFIAVLNDCATLVIAVDNAQISQRPDKWRIGQLITMSFVLAVFLTAASFAHFFIARDVFEVGAKELETIMYLHISSCPHFVIFSTRLSGFFWENIPSWTFTVAILGTQVFAMLISVFGVPGLTHAIGWGWGCGVLAISLGYFIVLDFVKVFLFRVWSFELTATLWPSPSRRRKLVERKAQKELSARVATNTEKVRTAVRAIGAVALLQNGVSEKRTTA
ncbi:plasma-membrane proton-e [Basidiobolus meristosporus CBS 931.73]|uniref:Plasma membrane ATPase n=1 Tax=Basidiobolus meristosporus CBS 931.73 TaxID=1314790 RepID=A0A1Y1Z640_9FUNG|nr:plasma-membrane proton-e [Basidiobolus meristosporus CBS 931.73]|eukprot:ORY05772.1 plasma-membrane proton-e [Basidiobolus meristosporus CBS 931.73]